MHQTSLRERLERARELLQTVRHPAIATVNEDGTPHCSPVFVAIDGKKLRLYWASHPDSQHSRNVARTGQAFITLFDSMKNGGGLYIQAKVHQLKGSDLGRCLKIFNARREQLLREELPMEFFTGDQPQRLYCAEPERLWVNIGSYDDEGRIVRDARHEITKDVLL